MVDIVTSISFNSLKNPTNFIFKITDQEHIKKPQRSLTACGDFFRLGIIHLKVWVEIEKNWTNFRPTASGTA